MICPECKKEGLKSKVYSLGGSATLIGHTPFYDEDGAYHSHDPNTMTQSYKCSNDHTWQEESKQSCWCGWPGEEK